MSVGVWFRRWLLPVLLAVCMLALGALVPGYLLDRQERELLQSTNTVPVSDVRPYGENYDQIKAGLLAALEVVRDGYYQEGTLSEDYWESGEGSQTMEGFNDFLIRWAGESQQPWLERLAASDLQNPNLVAGADGQEDFSAVMLERWSETEGNSQTWTLAVTSTAGIPVQMEFWVSPQEGYLSPQALWDGLLAAYWESCGLTFGPLQVTDGPTQNGTFDEETFRAGVEYFDWGDSGMEAYAGFSAVSSDLSFELSLWIVAYGSEDGLGTWDLVVQLWETEEELTGGSSQVYNNDTSW